MEYFAICMFLDLALVMNLLQSIGLFIYLSIIFCSHPIYLFVFLKIISDYGIKCYSFNNES